MVDERFAGQCIKFLAGGMDAREIVSFEAVFASNATVFAILTRADWLRKNRILIRLYECIDEHGDKHLADRFASTVREERTRVRLTVDQIRQIFEAGQRCGIPMVFIKSFQHYPDMGHDIDLLVRDEQGCEVDRRLGECLGWAPEPEGVFNRVSGKRTYQMPGFPSPVEIHHGRIGQVGEHPAFAQRILENKITYACGDFSVDIPCAEDQLVLQAIQRVYAHLTWRISDILQSIQLLRAANLNFSALLTTAERIGVLKGLGHYLSGVDDIFRRVFGQPLLDHAVNKALPRMVRARPVFKNGYYRVSIFPDVCRFFAAKCLVDLKSGHWDNVRRVMALPGLTVLHWGCRFICGQGQTS